MRNLDIFVRGGIMMWPVLFCLIVACILIVDRAFAFRRVETHSRKFLAMVNTLALRRDTKGVLDYCAERKSGLARIVQEAASHAGQGEQKVREAIEGVVGSECRQLERRLPLLSMVTSLAPMLGFFGTLSGMILIFRAVELHPLAASSLLAGRLWTVLLPAAFGLCVWIPLFAVHGFYTARVHRANQEMESTKQEVIRWFQEPLPEKETHTAAPSGPQQVRRTFAYDEDEYFRKKTEVKTR